jgi:hypothetical protein
MRQSETIAIHTDCVVRWHNPPLLESGTPNCSSRAKWPLNRSDKPKRNMNQFSNELHSGQHNCDRYHLPPNVDGPVRSFSGRTRT